MAVTAESYAKVVEEIAAFRNRIVSMVADEKNPEKICRLNFQFFPLTEKIEYDQTNVQTKKKGE